MRAGFMKALSHRLCNRYSWSKYILYNTQSMESEENKEYNDFFLRLLLRRVFGEHVVFLP